MKVANSYATLLRGVSQQTAEDRAEGQHAEQINMISDPVEGLCRRRGSVRLGEKQMTDLSVAQLPNYLLDTANYRTYDYSFGGQEYAVLYRSKARVGIPNFLPGALVYNKTSNTWLTTVRPVGDVQLTAAEEAGVAAVTSVGKYVFMSGNTVPAASNSVNIWNEPINLSRVVVWVRGGAYSRTYTVSVVSQTNVTTTVAYTTPSSSYQGVLTTSDILTSDPDYTKKVNDRVNDYNSAVTAWIGTSSAAVQPGAIATQLALLFNAAGITCVAIGSHICFDGGELLKSVTVDDGGDGSLMRGVADEINTADRTSVIHYVGKVVKVRGSGSSEAYYLKAVSKNPSVTSGYTEVTWVEGAGVQRNITSGLIYLTIVGSVAYWASSATLLATITPGPHPTFASSSVGDDDTSPMPYFATHLITYLGTFQNRLLIGSGGVLMCSRTDDYLNFFRSTALSLPANDAFEMFPQGSEDDVLVSSTLYDQDLVIFGRARQYVIPGSQALTPTSAAMPVMSSYENVTDAVPVSAGGFVFYAKGGTGFASLHQIQPGQTAKSPESYPASSQIGKYLAGRATEMVSHTGTPTNILFLRTDGKRNSVFTFSYLDKQDGRKLDAWSRWDFNPALGPVVGMSLEPDGLTIYFIRADGNAVWLVADRVSLLTSISDEAYLDSTRPYGSVELGAGSVTLASGASWAVVFDSTSTRRFTGVPLPQAATLLATYPDEPQARVGALSDASVTLTNPFMRDQKGKAITSGRLTITKLTVAYKNSAGFTWDLTYRKGVTESTDFIGRILGDPDNIIGVEPISTGQYSVPVGREVRDYTLTIKARKWYPFVLTNIEWGGQFFNRVQRF